MLLIGKELYLEASLQKNLSNEENSTISSVGFEYFRKFSNDYGDFLTADLQVRVPYIFGEEFPQSLTIEIHNAWLEYRAGLGKYIRVGHFAPAFGTETETDTHGSLSQTLAMRNVGFKQDWGVGFRSFIGNYDYFLTITSGSGMALRRDSFLFSGRLSRGSWNELQLAVSFLYGDVHIAKDMATYPVSRSLAIVTMDHIQSRMSSQQVIMTKQKSSVILLNLYIIPTIFQNSISYCRINILMTA
jgi:hypothetical protein